MDKWEQVARDWFSRAVDIRISPEEATAALAREFRQCEADTIRRCVTACNEKAERIRAANSHRGKVTQMGEHCAGIADDLSAAILALLPKEVGE